MKNFLFGALAAEESFSDKMVRTVDSILAFLASNTFRTILIILGVLLFLFILVRIYMRLRTSHLGNIEYVLIM